MSGWTIAALVIAAFAALPIIAILVAAPGGGADALTHLASTVLPRYVGNTLLLMLLAGAIAGSVGTACAWLVTASTRSW